MSKILRLVRRCNGTIEIFTLLLIAIRLRWRALWGRTIRRISSIMKIAAAVSTMVAADEMSK